MGWGESLSKTSTGGGGRFLRLEEGDAATVIFCGDLMERHTHWVGKTEQCQPVGCPHCAGGDSPRRRYLGIVYNVDEQIHMIWDFGYGALRSVKDAYSEAIEDDHAPDRLVWRIRRKGSRKETRYTLTPRGKADKQTYGFAADSDTWPSLPDCGGIPMGSTLGTPAAPEPAAAAAKVQTDDLIPF